MRECEEISSNSFGVHAGLPSGLSNVLREQLLYCRATAQWRFGLGFLSFWSLEAAAAFWVALRVDLLCGPGVGLQLPLLRGFFPGTGSKPGQQGFLRVVFFVVIIFC